LGVQDSLDSLDDFLAAGQEELQKFEVCLKQFANQVARIIASSRIRRETRSVRCR
jgi:hypothetical protein